MEKFNGDCDDEFDTCMDDKANCMAEGNTRKQCKKACKNTRTSCKDACDAATKCPACEDNGISGVGTPWCKLNTQYATASASERFCNDERYKVKCKKTCGLCD